MGKITEIIIRYGDTGEIRRFAVCPENLDEVVDAIVELVRRCVKDKDFVVR